MLALLFLLLLPCTWAFISPAGLPVFLHTLNGGPSVLVASIATGAARVPRLYALLATDTLRVQVAGVAAPELILWIAGTPRHFEAEPLLAPVPGCAICTGIVPIGRGSPLWNPYANITLTGDALLFDETRVRARPAPLPCAFATEGLCDLPARFQGSPTTLRLDFSRPETLVPAPLFFDYVQDAHPQTTRDWDDIHIELVGGPTIRIPGSGAVSAHVGFERQLFLAPYDGDAVLAGADILRYASFHWDVGAATVAVEPRVSARGYAWYTAVLLGVCVLAWFQLRELNRPGRLAKIAGVISIPVAAGAGVLQGRVLLADVTLLVLTCTVFALSSLLIGALLLVDARRGSVAWLWLDHLRTALALTNLLMAGFVLTLETSIYYYSGIATAILGLAWLYTTYEHWALVFRDTRKRRTNVYAAGWVVGLAWALALTAALHAWVFVPGMLALAPGGGAVPTLILLCLYVCLALAATYIVGIKHRINKGYLRSFR